MQENAIRFINLIKRVYFPNRKLHFRLHIHIFLHALSKLAKAGVRYSEWVVQANFFDVEIQIEMPHSSFESLWKTDIYGFSPQTAGAAEKNRKNQKGKKVYFFLRFPGFSYFCYFVEQTF